MYARRATLSCHLVSNRINQQFMTTNLPSLPLRKRSEACSRHYETVVSIVRASCLHFPRPVISCYMERDGVNTSWDSTMRISVIQAGHPETHHRHRLLIPALRPTPTSPASRTPCSNSGFSFQRYSPLLVPLSIFVVLVHIVQLSSACIESNGDDGDREPMGVPPSSSTSLAR